MRSRTPKTEKVSDPYLEKGLPSNDEAERAVLGAILLDNAICNQANELLRQDDFFLNSNRLIYDKMLVITRSNLPIDLVTLGDELRKAGEFEQVGGATYIASLIDGVPRTDDLTPYWKILRRCALERKRIHIAEQLARFSQIGEEDGDTSIDSLAQQIQTIQSQLRALDEGADVRDRIVNATELLGMEFEEPRYAVEGILPEGAIILAGRPKTGKSFLALSIAVAVAVGGYALGQIPVERGEVLYLGLEDGLRRLKLRLMPMLGRHTGLSGLNFKTKWRKLDDGGIADLEGWMKRHPDTRLIVIDTFKKVRPSERRGARIYDLDYEAVEMLASLAERVGVCILIVTHTNKRETNQLEDVFDAISGSIGLSGAADALLLLKRERGRCDAVLHISGRDIEERELALKVDQTIGSWSLLGEAEEFKMSEQRATIIKILSETFEPIGPHEIAEKAKMNPDSVRQLVRKMAVDSQIRQDGYGKYTTIDHSDHSNHIGNDDHSVNSAASDKTVMSNDCSTTIANSNASRELKDESIESVKGVITVTDAAASAGTRGRKRWKG